MSNFFKGILDSLKMTDDDYDEYDDDYDDGYDDGYEEEKQSRAPRKQSVADDYEEAAATAPKRDFAFRKEAPVKKNRFVQPAYDDYDEPAKSRSSRRASQKVVPMNQRTHSAMEVCVVKPANFEDAKEITETLLAGKAVVLNLEGLHVDMAQRIIDFASGSCYAMSGNLQKISSYIFIITPHSVDISGDVSEILNGGFDVSTL